LSDRGTRLTCRGTGRPLLRSYPRQLRVPARIRRAPKEEGEWEGVRIVVAVVAAVVVAVAAGVAVLVVAVEVRRIRGPGAGYLQETLGQAEIEMALERAGLTALPMKTTKTTKTTKTKKTKRVRGGNQDPPKASMHGSCYARVCR